MKQHLLLTIAFLVGMIGYTSAQDVPAAVVNAFNKMFPEAVDVEWEMDDEQWEAEFEMGDDMEYEAAFTPDGTWLETEKEIRTSEVPPQVLTATVKYPGYKMIGASESKTADARVTYELVMKQGDNLVQLVVDAQGMVLETESLKADNEDDDEDDDEGEGR